MINPCTCHPDDKPPKPCPHKYALKDCRKANQKVKKKKVKIVLDT